MTHKLNLITLARDYQLVKVIVPKRMTERFQTIVRNQAVAVVWIGKLKTKSDEIKPVYLLLIRRGDELPVGDEDLPMTTVNFSELYEQKVYPNQVATLLLNQQVVGYQQQSVSNPTPSLYVTKADWTRTLRDGRQQRWAVKVAFNSQQDMAVSVTTFTETTGKRPITYYVYDRKHQRMILGNTQDGGTIFEAKNKTNYRNQVDYFHFEDPDRFKDSKAGIIYDLIDALNRNMGDYFQSAITLRQVVLDQYQEKKLPATREYWQHFNNQVINVYPQTNDVAAGKLADDLYLALSDNKMIAENHCQVIRSDQSQPGVNIQAIRDARNEQHMIDAYETATPDRIIQHVTVENVGQLKQRQFSKVMEKLSQELMVKDDLSKGVLSAVAGEQLQVATRYTYVTFDWVGPKTAPKILVKRLCISQSGVLKIDKKEVGVSSPVGDDPLSQVCGEVMATLGGKAYQKFRWDRIDGALMWEDKICLIQQTDHQVLPDLAGIVTDLKATDPKTKKSKNEWHEMFTKLLRQDNRSDNYREFVQAILESIVSIHKVKLTWAEIKSALKENNHNFKGNIPRQVSDDLAMQQGFRLLPKIFQKKHLEMVRSFVGMGLLTIKGEPFYYVGGVQAPKKTVAKANRLRKLILIHVSPEEVADLFADMATLMAVNFVRNGQFTVLPYPIKYARESAESDLRKIRLGK